MKNPQSLQKWSWILILIVVLGFLYGWILPWVLHGGWPASGPTGEILPPHIVDVIPPDGAMVSKTSVICVYYSFQEGNGMGGRPSDPVRMYFDGKNVTAKLEELIDLLLSSTSGSFCYTPETSLSSGWHTTKVIYQDLRGERFDYTWRFLVEQ